MTYSIEQIKALRAGITPGKWIADKEDGVPYRVLSKGKVICHELDDMNQDDCIQNPHDTEFIAASKAIVDQLLEENDRLTKEVERLKTDLEEVRELPDQLFDQINDFKFRAQAAEDVAINLRNEDAWSIVEVREQIEKRIAELKGCEREEKK